MRMEYLNYIVNLFGMSLVSGNAADTAEVISQDAAPAAALAIDPVNAVIASAVALAAGAAIYLYRHRRIRV